MRVTLVGPSHPHPGGISQHTTRLALELGASGVGVTVESWRSQYPGWLYPEKTRVPDDAPEIGVPDNLVSRLNWYNPFSWWAAGFRARHSDLLVLNAPTPFHAIVYAVLCQAAGKQPRVVGIVHNPLPHEASRFDRFLMRWLMNTVDVAIVHGESQRAVLAKISGGDTPIRVTPLPSPWPELPDVPTSEAPSQGCRVLFFGTIRPYKGLAVLLEAIARLPEVSLLVAGRFWEERERYDELISALGIGDRVEVIDDYIDHRDFPELFARADVVALPYLSATASIVPDLAMSFHTPVIASAVGELGRAVSDGDNGLLVEPGNIDQLTDALRVASDPDRREHWRGGIASALKQNQALWADYCRLILDSAR